MKTRYALALAGMMLVPAAFAADTAPAAAPAAQPAPQAQGRGPMMKGSGQMMQGSGQMMQQDHAPMMDENGPLMMRDDLKLTDEQKPKVQSIFQEAKVKHEAIRKETHDKLAQVLTPEQLKKLEERRDMHMDRKADRIEKRKEKIKERQDGK